MPAVGQKRHGTVRPPRDYFSCHGYYRKPEDTFGASLAMMVMAMRAASVGMSMVEHSSLSMFEFQIV
jgi:hypothetical protein